MILSPAPRASWPRTDCRCWVRMNTIPSSAAKTRLIEALAAENRGLRNSAMSSIGWSRPPLPGDEGAASTTARRRGPPRTVGRAPAPLWGLDDRPDDRDQPGDREAGSDRVEPAGLAVAGLRDEPGAGDQRGDDDRHVDPEDGAPVEVLEQDSAGERAEDDPDARHGGPGGDRLRPLVRREDRRDDRERRGHDERAADSHQRPGGGQRSWCCRRAPTRSSRAAKTTSPNCSARLRPKRSPRLPAVSRSPAKTSR